MRLAFRYNRDQLTIGKRAACTLGEATGCCDPGANRGRAEFEMSTANRSTHFHNIQITPEQTTSAANSAANPVTKIRNAATI